MDTWQRTASSFSPMPGDFLQALHPEGADAMAGDMREHLDRFLSMPEELRRVVLDGFYALQQATFASPKRKSIAAYEEFVAGGGDLYVPTPEEKAAFKEAAAPVYDWFKANIDGGEEIFTALTEAVAAVEAELAEANAMDLK